MLVLLLYHAVDEFFSLDSGIFRCREVVRSVLTSLSFPGDGLTSVAVSPLFDT